MTGGGGQTREQVSGWTVDTLKEHFDDKIEDLKTQLTTKIDHAEETATQTDKTSQLALSEMRDSLKTRFASYNEFNQRMEKVTSDGLPRETFVQFKEQYATDILKIESRFSALAAEKAGAHENKQSGLEQQKMSTGSLSLVASAISALLALVAIMVTVLRAAPGGPP